MPTADSAVVTSAIIPEIIVLKFKQVQQVDWKDFWVVSLMF